MSLDPKVHFCRCGYTWKPRLYHKVVMLLRGEYLWQCPRCQSVMRFRLMNHVVKVGSKKMNEKIWRNG